MMTIEAEERGPFRSLPWAAARIGWNERTIRRRCVSVIEWCKGREASGESVLAYTERTGTVPSLRLGALHRIPLWWILAIEEVGEVPEPCCD